MFTHTIPGPPPAAGVAAGSVAFVVFAVVEVLIVGDVAITGEVAGVGDAVFGWNHERLAGVGDAATGAAVVAAASFFLERFGLVGLGDAAIGDSAVAAVAAGEASFFLECLCLATLGDASGLGLGVGLWATSVAAENVVNAINRPMSLFMPRRLGKAIASLQFQNN